MCEAERTSNMEDVRRMVNEPKVVLVVKRKEILKLRIHNEKLEKYIAAILAKC